jgi:hypothetical protein
MKWVVFGSVEDDDDERELLELLRELDDELREELLLLDDLELEELEEEDFSQ